MTVYIEKPAINLREELASLRNQGGYQEQQFYFDGLVTNGTLDADTDWTKGTGWTIAAGVATHTGATSGLNQVIPLTAGATYTITYTVSNYTASSVAVRLNGDTLVTGTSRTADGTYTETLVAPNGTVTFQLYGGIEGSIDNISVFQVDANDDVIHTMPKGWKPKDVFEYGLLQREGSAHDYEVIYDGFTYKVKPTVAPTATTETCVIGVKA